MMNARILSIFLLCFIIIPDAIAGLKAETDSLLNELDNVISQRDIYNSRKESEISALRQKISEAADERERFFALGNLFSAYNSYSADSAYSISLRQEAIANRSGDNELVINAKLNKANTLGMTGMYHETLKLAESIDYSDVPDYLRAYYFHTMRTMYGNLADVSVFEPDKANYEALTEAYRDSLLSVYDRGSMIYHLIKADQLNVHNRPKEAIELLSNYMKNNQLSEHDKAICAFTLSDSYGLAGDTANRKKQLLISAISDIKTAVREYVSLRELALMLYQEGDLDRAYRFLTMAVDDASKCNARHRIVDLNASYPMINGIYVEKVHSQKKALERTIIIITVLFIVAIGLLVYIRKQMLHIARQRRTVVEANDKLNELNGRLTESNERLNDLVGQLKQSNDRLNEVNTQLTQSNDRLHDANCAIQEISELKEVYIGRYMDQSLAYIEMLDAYRKSVGKLLGSGKMDELRKLVKSTTLVDDELKSFYEEFDRTFLSLFPTFVEDFNALLLPDEAIIPKKAGCLNAELRIYALIRLGITDSDKIAKFLRYSLTTIYNYRTKVRNKARGDRNRLENEVARIGLQSSDR